MAAKWFYGVDTKEKFLRYFESAYTYQRLISIHPIELQEIAKEAITTALRLNVRLPDYVDGMADDPVSFSEEALDLGIVPDYSEITKLNLEYGTEYRNMVEYSEHISKFIAPVKNGEPSDPLMVMAHDESESIDDVDSYLAGVLK